MSKVPQKEPQINREELMKLIATHYPDFKLNKFAVIGLRGYYKDTMGKVGENDRSIYDDALIILTETEMHAFNGNCDPSIYRPGIAKLKAGVWPVYKFDLHKGKYLALCQRAGNVTVFRDGKGEDTGMFGINIHKGGYNTTSSEGCQTSYPSQWDRFIGTATRICRSIYGDKFKSNVYTYVLIDM